MHYILDEFAFRPDRTKYYGVGCPWHKAVFSLVCDPIFIILAGKEDMHKRLDEFEFRPYPTINYGVSCS